MIGVSIYMKDTGQIVSTRTVQQLSDLDILPSTQGYIEGIYDIIYKKWNGTAVVDYAPPYVSGSNESEVRKKRNMLLDDSDWTQMPDTALTDSKKAEWATYRQALRDMMASYTDSESNTVENTTFPTKPSS